MSRVCTLCHKTINSIHYVCKYGNGVYSVQCTCTLHQHCFEKTKQDVSSLLSCQCHPLHTDTFVRKQVEEDTSDSSVAEGTSESSVPVQVAESEHEKKKKSDFQGHPDDLVWFIDLNTPEWRQIKRSEAEELEKINDAKGIPRARGI